MELNSFRKFSSSIVKSFILRLDALIFFIVIKYLNSSAKFMSWSMFVIILYAYKLFFMCLIFYFKTGFKTEFKTGFIC